MSGDLYYRVSVTAGSVDYDLSPDLTSLTIEEENTKPDQLTVVMSDPFKVLSHAVQEGMEVEVDLGTADDHSIVFRGRIYKTEGDFPQDGVPTHKLIAHDTSMAMGLHRHNRCWTDMALSDLVRAVASAVFDTDVEVSLLGDPKFTGNGIRQQDETDLAFLRRLGTLYGFESFVVSDEEADMLHCIAQKTIMQQTPEVTLFHGRCDVPGHLLNFQASGSVSDIRLQRVFSGIDGASGELIEPTTAEQDDVGEQEDNFLDENLTAFREREPERADQLQDLLDSASGIPVELREELGSVERMTIPGFTTPEELSARQKNQFSTSLHGIRGSGSTPGNHRLRAQTTIGINDVGGRFSGIWFLAQVRHVLNQQGYLTEITCQR